MFFRFQVSITITDINDNSPQFLNEPYLVSAENALIFQGFLIAVEASDRDEGVNAEISFSVVRVDQDSVNGISTVFVLASDNGSPSLSAETTVNVTFAFSETCLQEYSIDSVTGNLMIEFLCSVAIEPEDQLVQVNSVYSLTCTLEGFLRTGTVRLLRNNVFNGDSIALLPGDTVVTFQDTSADFTDEGLYLCEVRSNVGSVVSPNPASVRIGGESAKNIHCNWPLYGLLTQLDLLL